MPKMILSVEIFGEVTVELDDSEVEFLNKHLLNEGEALRRDLPGSVLRKLQDKDLLGLLDLSVVGLSEQGQEPPPFAD